MDDSPASEQTSECDQVRREKRSIPVFTWMMDDCECRCPRVGSLFSLSLLLSYLVIASTTLRVVALFALLPLSICTTPCNHDYQCNTPSHIYVHRPFIIMSACIHSTRLKEEDREKETLRTKLDCFFFNRPSSIEQDMRLTITNMN